MLRNLRDELVELKNAAQYVWFTVMGIPAELLDKE